MNDDDYISDREEEIDFLMRNQRLLSRAFNEWKERLAKKKERFRKLVIARYEIEFKRKKRIFEYLSYNKTYSYNLRILLMEQMVRRSQQLKQKVFDSFHKIKQKKELRSEFFAKMCYFYHDFILKKYFDIVKNQKELKWEYDALKQKVIIFWKQNMMRRYFSYLKQAKILRLQQDRVLQKKINICKLIFKKTHARLFLSKLRENVLINQGLKDKLLSMEIFKMDLYFKKLKQYWELKQIQKKRIDLAINYNNNRFGQLLKQKYLKILKNFAKNSQEHKRKKEQLRKKMVKKYYNVFISQLEYNFNVNIYYADKHYESKIIKTYFDALKIYQKIVHYHKIKSQKQTKQLVKECFNSLKNYWKKAKLETKKRYLISRSKQKFIKQFAWRQWREKFISKQAEGMKEKDMQQIAKQTYLRKSFELLRIYKNKQKSKNIEIKKTNLFVQKRYFKHLTDFYNRKKGIHEKERKARQFFFRKSVSFGFNQLKEVFIKKRAILDKIIEKERQQQEQVSQKVFEFLKEYKAEKQKKKSKYVDFLNRNLLKQKSSIFNAFKSNAKRKLLKQIDLSNSKKQIQSGLLKRILNAWKNRSYLKKNTRMFFEEKQTIIQKKIGFKRLQKCITEVKGVKQKLRGMKLKKMIKMKKIIFDHMKLFLWKKQIKKQDLKEKENIYLAKLLIKSLFAWRLYMKALKRAKQKVKYAVIHWSQQKKKISFKKVKEFLVIKKQKRQEELDAFNLHVAHQQHDVIKRVIMMGLELKEKKIKMQKQDVIKLKLREQDLLVKYGRKWLNFYEQRKVLKQNMNNNQNRKRQSQKQDPLQQQQGQQRFQHQKDTLVFDKSNKKQHFHHISFFPNQQQQNKEYFSENSDNNNNNNSSQKQLVPQQQQQFQQNTPINPSFKSNNPTFRQGSEDKADEILNWFEKDFLSKNKMVPKRIGSQEPSQQQQQYQGQSNQKTIQLNKQQFQQMDQKQLKFIQGQNITNNSATTKQQIYSKQNLTNNLFSNHNEAAEQRKQGSNNISTYSHGQLLNKSIQQPQQKWVQASQTNFQYGQQNTTTTNLLHLSNIAQLLDQDHSTTIIEDIKEKNRQLELIIAEYQQKKSNGDQVRVAQLKPLIQEKLLEIKQLKNNI